jgi:hypothetical protein
MAKKQVFPRDRNGKVFGIGSVLRDVPTGNIFTVGGYTVGNSNAASAADVSKVIGKPAFEFADVELVDAKKDPYRKFDGEDA